MKNSDHYHKGLFFITYLLLNSDNEISDNELFHMHKMRIEEGMSDATFVDHFKSIIGKSEQEIYQIGIESLNKCSQEYKIRAFALLYNLAFTECMVQPREVRLLLYAMNLTKMDLNKVLDSMRYKVAAA
jgi:hypothetical protein